MRKVIFALILALPFARIATGADTVPTDIEMPGTQPQEIGNLESPNKCDNCHGGYNKSVEPAHNWRGSLMAQAGRDPIFWATMAIAEQDFDGSGDLCLRCHSTGGWLAGRSTPTDGSGLAAGDSDGVECDYCHKLTNPADLPLEPQGVMNDPYVANDGNEGWYGSGMSSMWGGNDKLGPYTDADARHQFMYSKFHRDPEFCGTCHDVSNPAVGDLAHNNGAFQPLANGSYSGELESAVDGKAAFNNAPYLYGIVERTFSEHMSSPLSTIAVDDFHTYLLDPQDEDSGLPTGGAFEAIYDAATAGGSRSADYATPYQERTYTCQTCHMRPVTGTGANKKGVPVRDDLPLHDMTGGNYWMAEAIIWLDDRGRLRLGGGLTADQKDAMQDAAIRAREQLALAATLEVDDEDDGTVEVKIVNNTGHKLITGYPEGRRMWLNVKWYDAVGNELPDHEIGHYGDLNVTLNGGPLTVRTITDLEASKDYIFEAHMGMTKEWANQLLSLGYDELLALAYDRNNGATTLTLGQLANGAEDEAATFHFAINNTVKSDNRIPPFGMDYETARQRNATPVPDTQYGDPNADSEESTYDHYAEFHLAPPAAAVSAEISLLYQPTSWEYIQFLYLANDGSVAFLADEGVNMLEAWQGAGMAEPEVMVATTWTDGTTEPPPTCELEAPSLISASPGDKYVALDWTEVIATPEVTSYNLYYDQSGKAQLITLLPCTLDGCPLSYTDTDLDHEQNYCYKVTAQAGECESGFSNIRCATPLPPGQVSSVAGVSELVAGVLVRTGKGKNATEVFEPRSGHVFTAGENIVFRARVTDADGSYVAGANVNYAISGPDSLNLTSVASDGNGIADATWSTQAPNKKGNGGTTVGSYTTTVSGLSSSTHEWDTIPVSIQVTLNP